MSPFALPGALVSVAWLSGHLQTPDLVVFDARIGLPDPLRIPEPASISTWQYAMPAVRILT